jgi:chromate transporter
VLIVATRLGFTCFGGPIAHLGYFRDEYVHRRRWVDDRTYADLVALCSFLPGPTSSELGIALGTLRAGPLGGLAAWIGFTLPSAIALVLFAYGVGIVGTADVGWLRGLKVVAVAVVAQAVWGMARILCPDRARATIAVFAAILALASPNILGQLLVIVLTGLIGWRLLPAEAEEPAPALPGRMSRRVSVVALTVLVGLLVGLPFMRHHAPSEPLAVFDSFFRAGALVLGGGHVVLPLLQSQVVPPGWISNEQFLAGYGAAQAVPGPLFTFAAYLGATMTVQPNGWIGAGWALLAIFLPAFLYVFAALPWWDSLRQAAPLQAALRGINAGVVGILVAALYHPVWTSAISTAMDFGLALAAGALLMLWKVPPWLVVMICAGAGALLPRV